MPLSTENESFGSPSMFHARILTGSPRVDCSEKDDEHGTDCSPHAAIHCAITRSRKGRVNGPRYEMKPDAMSTSPVMFVYCLPSASDASAQRIRSPPRPPSSRCARSSLVAHSSTWRARSSFLATVSSNCSCSAFIFASTFASPSRFSASSAEISAYSASASASAFRFGATTLATRSYTSIARTQQQRPYAALEALAIFSGTNSGLSTYLLIFSITSGLMLSLS